MKINIIKKKDYCKEVKFPEYGDIVCWTEKNDINKDYWDEPLWITRYGLVMFNNPNKTWSLISVGVLNYIYELLRSGELRYMDEVEKIEIINNI